MITTAKKLNLENLESRICLAGNVTVDIEIVAGLDGFTAVFRGDQLANTVQIVQVDRNDYTALGIGFEGFDTTINGSNQVQLENITNFIFDLKGGDDFLFINGDPNLAAPNEVTIDGFFHVLGKGGNDNVLIENTIIRGDFDAELGAGNNFLQWIDSRVIGDTFARSAGGEDLFGAFRSVFHQDVNIHAGGGKDNVLLGSAENELHGSRFLGGLHLNSGPGDDVIRIDESVIKGDTKIKTGNGDDQLSSRRTRIRTDYDVRVWTGNGDDTMALEFLNIAADSTMIRTGNGEDQVGVMKLRYQGIGSDNFSFYGGRHNDTVELKDSKLFGEFRFSGQKGDDSLIFSGLQWGLETGRSVTVDQGAGMSSNSLEVDGGQGSDFASLTDLIIRQTDSTPGLVAERVENHHVQNLSLVIGRTPQIQDEIRDLLDKLRRLQDLQVTVEVQFITLNDSFFERIGVEFDFEPNTDTGSVKLTSTDSPNAFDYEFALNPEEFNFSVNNFVAAPRVSVPDFGAFDPFAGLNLSTAILSDLDTFFFIQAARGDHLRPVHTFDLFIDQILTY